jgi:DNA replication protein DnaC
MSPIDELIPLLKKLRLSGILQTLELRAAQAVDDDLAHAEFLLRLLTDEVERRDSKMLEQRIRRANFDHRKTLEDFDFHFNPRVPRAKIIDLATCAFVARRHNVLLVGPSGVGKSHIAQALGQRACLHGYKVLCVTAHDMLRQLRAARGEGNHERCMLRFTGPELVIIDDLGLRSLDHDETMDLYDIIRLRYERFSTIITSNRALDEFPAIFGDPLLASAALDRLLHDAHVLVIEGDSYRNPPAQKRAARRSAPRTKSDAAP